MSVQGEEEEYYQGDSENNDDEIGEEEEGIEEQEDGEGQGENGEEEFEYEEEEAEEEEEEDEEEESESQKSNKSQHSPKRTGSLVPPEPIKEEEGESHSDQMRKYTQHSDEQHQCMPTQFNFKKQKTTEGDSPPIASMHIKKHSRESLAPVFNEESSISREGTINRLKDGINTDERSPLDRDSLGLNRFGVDEHIRQYNILMEDTQTVKQTEDGTPWENYSKSKSKISESRISPQPNLLARFNKKGDTSEDDGPLEIEPENKIVNRGRPHLAEDFSDLTEEARSYKRKVVSNQNSSKNDRNGSPQLFTTTDKHRTFADQLRKDIAGSAELSEPDPIEVKIGAGKAYNIHGRMSECTRKRKVEPADIDFDEIDGRECDSIVQKSPEFPSRIKDRDMLKPVPQIHPFKEKSPPAVDGLHQFTFKDQAAHSPAAQPQSIYSSKQSPPNNLKASVNSQEALFENNRPTQIHYEESMQTRTLILMLRSLYNAWEEEEI